jgi:hypothetical protein
MIEATALLLLQYRSSLEFSEPRLVWSLLGARLAVL